MMNIILGGLFGTIILSAIVETGMDIYIAKKQWNCEEDEF